MEQHAPTAAGGLSESDLVVSFVGDEEQRLRVAQQASRCGATTSRPTRRSAAPPPPSSSRRVLAAEYAFNSTADVGTKRRIHSAYAPHTWVSLVTGGCDEEELSAQLAGTRGARAVDARLLAGLPERLYALA